MSNGDIPEWNCVIGACCSTVEDRTRALAAQLFHHLNLSGHYTREQCHEIAAMMLTLYDLAPVGYFLPLVYRLMELKDGPSFTG